MNNFRIKKTLLTILPTLFLLVGFSSCEESHVTPSELDENNTAIISQYVNNVVVETYASLADESVALYNACFVLYQNPTQANVQTACDAWKSARKYWELSEAFLYGAAADYNIDPHIDSWPLDKAQLDLALKNTTLIANMRENGCNFDGFATLGYGLLGFHAVEYILFRDGQARKMEGGVDTDGVTYAALSETELIYCQAVAEDLRNQCIRLEASWAGLDNVNDEKQTILADTELEPSMNYGEALITAGETGNVLYKSQVAALVQILQGAADISDEVGNTKITDPVNSGNVLDVESWYSWNSLADFADNIRSVRNVYLGTTDGTEHQYSVSSYVRGKDTTIDSNIKTAFSKAISEIESMPAPFRNNLTVAASKSAVDACNELLGTLDAAIELIQ